MEDNGINNDGFTARKRVRFQLPETQSTGQCRPAEFRGREHASSQRSHSRRTSRSPIPRVTAAKSRLCGTCREIDFEYYIHKKLSKVHDLGSWGDIIDSQACPFCRLVVEAFKRRRDQPLPHLYDHIRLTNILSWQLGVELSPFDPLKSEAFSNKFDLRSIARDISDKSYRLVVFVEGASAHRGIIQFIPNRDGQHFLGRKVNNDRVRIKLLKNWLDDCGRHHGSRCNQHGRAGNHLPRNLRFIDVRNRTIVKAERCRELEYVTLSYVWGEEAMLKEDGVVPVILKNNSFHSDAFGEECTPLSGLANKLPQTIEDAINLTERLGYQYLWVDALCLIQDDLAEDKQRHLDRMDAVYNCSALTIVAASGHHGNCGLPGISIPRSRGQSIELIRGGMFSSMAPSFTQLEKSETLVWNTRGWTFQEKILAKRLLIFADQQVYFKCSEAIWTEEIVMETDRLSKAMEARKEKYRWAADRPEYIPSSRAMLIKMLIPKLEIDNQWSYLGSFPDYAAAVREYSRRSLTKESDVLNAIKGVFRTLESDCGDFIFGLPSQYFSQSLLWFPRPGSRLTRINRHFPSWAWAGWRFDRGVVYNVLDIRALRALLILLRKSGKEILKLLGRSLDSASTGSSSSSTSTSSPYTSTTSSYPSSSGSGSASGPGSGPGIPPPPIKLRDWSTRDITTRAMVNMAACFGWSLCISNHTVKRMVLCENDKIRDIRCEEPLTISIFSSENAVCRAAKVSRPRRRTRERITHHRHTLASELKTPVLSMETVVVQFYIGRCLQAHAPTHEDETGIFELVMADGSCVGEVWTTKQMAAQGRKIPFDFLTISWGLSINHANIDEKFIPRWTMDAGKLPNAESVENLVAIVELVLGQSKLGLTDGPDAWSEPMPGQPSTASFFNELLRAEKGRPRPMYLWSAVNLIQVTWDGSIAQRVGVAKVIFDAWGMHWSKPEMVQLA